VIPILPLLPLYLDMSDSSDDDAFQGQVPIFAHCCETTAVL